MARLIRWDWDSQSSSDEYFQHESEVDLETNHEIELEDSSGNYSLEIAPGRWL